MALVYYFPRRRNRPLAQRRVAESAYDGRDSAASVNMLFWVIVQELCEVGFDREEPGDDIHPLIGDARCLVVVFFLGWVVLSGIVASDGSAGCY